MACVLVTGANGHVGANTVRSLLRRGHDVVAFIRRTADTRGIENLPLQYRYGDMMDSASVIAAAEGCDVVIHTATVFTSWSKDPNDILQPALIGTRHIFAAAKAAGVRRLVYTSSIAAIGYAQSPDVLRSEADWYDDPQNPYHVAKVRSEQEALRLSETLDVPTIRLCPGLILGPYDYRITPSMRIVADILNGDLIHEGGLNFVDVRDVAEVHAAAVEVGEPGQRYAVGGANLHMKELAAIITRSTGIVAKPLPGGRRLALLMGRIFDLVSRITGRRPYLSWSEAYEYVGRYGYLDSSLAIRTFGVKPRDIEETIRDTIRWLLHIGATKRQLAPEYVEQLAPDPEW